MAKTVLLIGRNLMVLTQLASALTDKGFVVKTTNLIEQASQDFNGADFDLIAFGRGVDEKTNELIRTRFSVQHPALLFVDGLAPVIPLLVKQIESAFTDEATHEKVITSFSSQYTENLHLNVSTASDSSLKIDLYQLDAAHQTQQKTLVSEFVTAGNHLFSREVPPETKSIINFLVAEADNHDIVILPLQ